MTRDAQQHEPSPETCGRYFYRGIKRTRVLCGGTLRKVHTSAGAVLCYVCDRCGKHYGSTGEAL